MPKDRKTLFLQFAALLFMSAALVVYAWLNTRGCPNEEERLKKFPTARKLLRVKDFYSKWQGYPEGPKTVTVSWPEGQKETWLLSERIHKFDSELNRLHILPLPPDITFFPGLKSVTLSLDGLRGTFPVTHLQGRAIVSLPGKKLIFADGDIISHLEWARKNLEWERGAVVSHDPKLFFEPEKSGFSCIEGPYPGFADYLFFWGLYPESRLEMESFSSEKVLMALTLRTVMEGQRMAIFINDTLAQHCRIEKSKTLNTLKIPLDLRQGRNEVLFRYQTRFIGKNDPRPLAVLFSRIELFPHDQVPERIKKPALPGAGRE